MFSIDNVTIIHKLKEITNKITSISNNINIVKNNIFASDDANTYNAAEWAKLTNTNIHDVNNKADNIIAKLNNSSIDSLFQTTSICSTDVWGDKTTLFSGSITAPSSDSSYVTVATFTAPQTGTYYFTLVQSGNTYYGGYRTTRNNIVLENISRKYNNSTQYFVYQLNKNDIMKIETYGENSSSSSTAKITCTELSYQIINNVHSFATNDVLQNGAVERFVATETGKMFIGVRASTYLYLEYTTGGVSYRLNQCKADEDNFYTYGLQEYIIPVYKGCAYDIHFHNSDSHHSHSYNLYIRACNSVDVTSPKIIKSVQRGTTSTSEGSVIITLGQVDMSKCLVLVDNGSYTELTDTSLTIQVPITYNDRGNALSTTCAWQVIEFW